MSYYLNNDTANKPPPECFEWLFIEDVDDNNYHWRFRANAPNIYLYSGARVDNEYYASKEAAIEAVIAGYNEGTPAHQKALKIKASLEAGEKQAPEPEVAEAEHPAPAPAVEEVAPAPDAPTVKEAAPAESTEAEHPGPAQTDAKPAPKLKPDQRIYMLWVSSHDDSRGLRFIEFVVVRMDNREREYTLRSSRERKCAHRGGKDVEESFFATQLEALDAKIAETEDKIKQEQEKLRLLLKWKETGSLNG